MRCEPIEMEPSGILTFDADSESPKELGILHREPENRFLMGIGIERLPVDEIDFAPFVEPNGDFKNEEEIVAGGTDAGEDFGNLV